MKTTQLGQFTIQYTNEKEFKGIKEEIFNSNSYYFRTQNNDPIIVDCGSHIGISIMYFKTMYPDSIIYGYEPNPISFKILEQNITQNGIKDAYIKNVAVDIRDSTKSFYIDTSKDLWLSTSGYINGSWKKLFNDEEFKVQAIDFGNELENILNKHKHIDILKIDIEGYEIKIIQHIDKYLKRIQNIVMEYHPIQSNRLDRVLDILKQNYNNIEFEQDGKKVRNPSREELLIIRCSNE